jgi:acetate---CoA ligase (ADP-forming)
VFSSAAPSEVGEALRAFDEAKVPVMPSPSRAARAIAMLLEYRRAQLRMSRTTATETALTSSHADPRLVAAQRGASLSEADSKAMLAAAGIPVTRDIIVKGDDASVFDSMKAPLVVKIVSPDIAHKTEIGGVKVGIRTRSELEAAMSEVLQNAKQHAPSARIDGVLVSEMVRGGFELIAGAVNDVVFGPVIVVGAGGIYTELLRDSACRLAPFDELTAREMIDELKCRRILDGARGGAPLDVDAVAAALSALSRFAWENRDCVKEIDVNPLFVTPQGVVAADALIIPVETKDEEALV